MLKIRRADGLVCCLVWELLQIYRHNTTTWLDITLCASLGYLYYGP